MQRRRRDRRRRRPARAAPCSVSASHGPAVTRDQSATAASAASSATAAPASIRIASAKLSPLRARQCLGRAGTAASCVPSRARSTSTHWPRSSTSPSVPASSVAISVVAQRFAVQRHLHRKSSNPSSPTAEGARAPTVPSPAGAAAGWRATLPACARPRRRFPVRRRWPAKRDASRGVQRSGWKISPASTIGRSQAHVSAARCTGSSSDSSLLAVGGPGVFAQRLAQRQMLRLGLRRQPRRVGRHEGERRSASRRFSARLKCTRPTRFQAGFSRLRKLCRSVPAAASEVAQAPAPIPPTARAARPASDIRRPASSAPSAPARRSSASVGAGTSGSSGSHRLRRRTHAGTAPPRSAPRNARHQTNTGGRGLPDLAGTSRSSPWPLPRANASLRPAATAVVHAGRIVGRFADEMPVRGKAQTLTRHGWSTLHRRVVVKTLAAGNAAFCCHCEERSQAAISIVVTHRDRDSFAPPAMTMRSEAFIC